jgi:hypothetical protein
LQQRLSEATAIARERERAENERQADRYNKGRRQNQFQVGDLVLRETHIPSDADKGVAHLLTPKFEGPYRLAKQISENTYILESSDGDETCQRNADQLRPYVPLLNWS